MQIKYESQALMKNFGCSFKMDMEEKPSKVHLLNIKNCYQTLVITIYSICIGIQVNGIKQGI